MKRIFLFLLLILLAVFIQPAYGTVYTQDFLGEITFAASGNPFGVVTGNDVPWETTYDGTGVPAVGSTQKQPINLNIHIGSYTFDESNDYNYASGYPKLYFTDGNVVGVDALVRLILAGSNEVLYGFTTNTPLPDANGNFNPDFATFSIFSYNLADVNWNTGFPMTEVVSGNLFKSPSAVPIPPSVLLLGTGLIGLAGFRRKLR